MQACVRWVSLKTWAKKLLAKCENPSFWKVSCIALETMERQALQKDCCHGRTCIRTWWLVIGEGIWCDFLIMYSWIMIRIVTGWKEEAESLRSHSGKMEGRKDNFIAEEDDMWEGRGHTYFSILDQLEVAWEQKIGRFGCLASIWGRDILYMNETSTYMIFLPESNQECIHCDYQWVTAHPSSFLALPCPWYISPYPSQGTEV